jgi:hypothetical protein
VRAALDERRESQACTIRKLDQALDRRREAAKSDAEKLSAMAGQVPGRDRCSESRGAEQKAAKHIDLARSEASGLKEVPGSAEGNHEKPRARPTSWRRIGDGNHSSEGPQSPEEGNRSHRETSEQPTETG